LNNISGEDGDASPCCGITSNSSNSFLILSRPRHTALESLSSLTFVARLVDRRRLVSLLPELAS
jgi:hypothetical protein